MELYFSVLLTVLSIIILTILTYTMITKNPKKQTRIPGPRKLPIIGNLHNLVSRTTLPYRRLTDLASTFGPVMHLTLGEVPTIIISSSDAAKAVMKTNDTVFCDRPRIMLAQILYYNCSDIAIAPYGEYWRQVRKIATLEMLTSSRVHSFKSVRVEEVIDLVKGLGNHLGNLANLSQLVFDLNFNITLRTAMNKKGIDGRAFKALALDMSKFASGFNLADLYPSVKVLPSITGMKRKLKQLVKRADILLDPIIEEHIRKMQKSSSEENVVQDFIDILLTYHKGDFDSNLKTKDFSLTIDNIKAIVLELFIAGSETTSTTIEWAIAELLKNEGAMKKAKDEVRQAYQGKFTFDETRLVELKYLKNVIKETFRLHPPLPLLVPRQSMDHCQINGHEIDPGTRVFINVWAIGRDPKHWKDPEKFEPERFEGSTVDYKGNHFELTPFGAGRRMCPGLGFGIATIELVLSALLYHFDLKLPQGITPENFDMDEAFGIISRRKNDLNVIPIAYNHINF